jgi:hypothetical protein
MAAGYGLDGSDFMQLKRYATSNLIRWWREGRLAAAPAGGDGVRALYDSAPWPLTEALPSKR